MRVDSHARKRRVTSVGRWSRDPMSAARQEASQRLLSDFQHRIIWRKLGWIRSLLVRSVYLGLVSFTPV